MHRAILTAAILLLLISGCDAVEPNNSSSWQQTGPYTGFATALHLSPDGSALALSKPSPYGGHTKVYERPSTGSEWLEVFDEGSHFVYAGPSGRLYTGRSRGGLRWRDSRGRWHNEAEAFRTPAGCSRFANIGGEVLSVVETGERAYAGTHCGLFEVPSPIKRVAFEGQVVSRLAAGQNGLVALVDGTLYMQSAGQWGVSGSLDRNVTALVSGESGTLYARQNDTIWRSVDGGGSWAEAGTLPRSVRKETRLAAGKGSLLYASGTESTGVSWAEEAFLVSGDGGGTWEPMPVAQSGMKALAALGDDWIAASPEVGPLCGKVGARATACADGLPGFVDNLVPTRGALYALLPSRVVMRTTDGLRWTAVGTQRGERLQRFGDSLAIPIRNSLAVSADGSTWHDQRLPFALKELVDVPQGVFPVAIDLEGGVWRYDTHNALWVDLAAPEPLTSVVFGLDGHLYGHSGTDFVQWSPDSGWTDVFGSLTLKSGGRFVVAADGVAFAYHDVASFRWKDGRWSPSDRSLAFPSADPFSGRLFLTGPEAAEWKGGRWVNLADSPEHSLEIIAWRGKLYARTAAGVFSL
ncbi:MAG: hypothetical protein JJ896_14470 [Rhodothermales bacterium]|nr:hypothetical protein [Rhodothermales bacterium]MBO6780855.1 hypothetical protein [Rhodothermales bacterium]